MSAAVQAPGRRRFSRPCGTTAALGHGVIARRGPARALREDSRSTAGRASLPRSAVMRALGEGGWRWVEKPFPSAAIRTLSRRKNTGSCPTGRDSGSSLSVLKEKFADVEGGDPGRAGRKRDSHCQTAVFAFRVVLARGLLGIRASAARRWNIGPPPASSMLRRARSLSFMARAGTKQMRKKPAPIGGLPLFSPNISPKPFPSEWSLLPGAPHAVGEEGNGTRRLECGRQPRPPRSRLLKNRHWRT